MRSRVLIIIGIITALGSMFTFVTIADFERENLAFQEMVRTFITPMISTLSIMTLAEAGNDIQVLGLGISVIALNLGMYIAVPVAITWQIKKQIFEKEIKK